MTGASLEPTSISADENGSTSPRSTTTIARTWPRVMIGMTARLFGRFAPVGTGSDGDRLPGVGRPPQHAVAQPVGDHHHRRRSRRRASAHHRRRPRALLIHRGAAGPLPPRTRDGDRQGSPPASDARPMRPGRPAPSGSRRSPTRWAQRRGPRAGRRRRTRAMEPPVSSRPRTRATTATISNVRPEDPPDAAAGAEVVVGAAGPRRERLCSTEPRHRLRPARPWTRVRPARPCGLASSGARRRASWEERRRPPDRHRPTWRTRQTPSG